MKKLVITLTTPRGDLYLSRGEFTRYLRRRGPDGYVIWSAARQFAGAWEADETVTLPAGTEMCIVDIRNNPLYTETITESNGIAERRAPFAQESVYAIYEEYAAKYGLVDYDALCDWLAPDAKEHGFEGDIHTWIFGRDYQDVTEYSILETRGLLGHKVKVARWSRVHRVCGKRYSSIEVQTDIRQFQWPSGFVIDD